MVVGTVGAPAALVAGGCRVSRHVRPLRRRTALAADALPAELSPLLRRIYAARHVTDAMQLTTGLEALLPVSSLENVQAAARLLLLHRERHILVIGDFDADGATSSALMLRALRSWKFAQVDFLVPDRFRFGYGLTPQMFPHSQHAYEHMVSLPLYTRMTQADIERVATAVRRALRC